jgi:hypothetical protein
MQNMPILASTRRSSSLNEDSVVDAVILSDEVISVEYAVVVRVIEIVDI